MIKKIILIIFLCFYKLGISQIKQSLSYEVADGTSYQAVLIDHVDKEVAGLDFTGVVLPNKALNVKFTILSESCEGPIEYQEIQSVYTDATGMFSCIIGHGSATSMNDSITKVPWAFNKHFLKVETDILKKDNYKLLSCQQIMASPYAFFALDAGGTTPPGGIIIYTGSDWAFDTCGLGLNELHGWALCNGKNNTPDLSNKFVMSKTDLFDFPLTGGADSIQLIVENLPLHAHTFITDDGGEHAHAITLSHGGGHTHTITYEPRGAHSHLIKQGNHYIRWGDGGGSSDEYIDAGGGAGGYGGAVYADIAGAHRHVTTSSPVPNHTHGATISTNNYHSHEGITDSTSMSAPHFFDNRPRFYKVVFIMKL